MSSPHPSPQALSRYLGGDLAMSERATLEGHLQGCVLCRAELSLLRELNLATTQREVGFDETHTPEPRRGPLNESTEEITTGFEVGRYIVTRRLGQGAMGLVFAAYDPRLDRNVALKLLRPDLPMVGNKPLRARLEREAQALAKLSHPNVVAVHDLGDFGDALFIAMDLVEGQTLTEWLRTEHPWKEVQRVFLMAGAGLAAAHRAGLVHRDFKPDNVLVGADGVVRVSDFGVSRRVTTGEGPEEDTITGAGSLIGTPMYMSPEQFDGKPADPRSDQFSFCVALFEALCGQKPFRGDSLRALADAAHAGPPQRIPSRVTLPRWLERVALRGLSAKPEQRFESMDALLTALEGPRRRALLWPTVTAVAMVAAGLLTWREVVRRREDPCRKFDARATAAWAPGDRAAVTQALADAKVPWAGATATHVDATFRRFLERWRSEYRAVCTARDEGRETNLATRQACLDERLASFEALKTRMASAPVSLREGLGRLSMALETGECGVRPWFLELPADPTRRADFLRLRDAYFQLQSEALLELSGEQLARTTALRTEAQALGFSQLVAVLRLLESSFLLQHGLLKEAVAAMEEAAVLAEASHLDVIVADARSQLVRTLAEDVDVKRARALVPSMRAAFTRAGGNPDESLACLESEASVLAGESRPLEAIEKMKKAIAQLPEGSNVMVRADEDRILAYFQGLAGQWDDSLATADRAVAELRVALGPVHPAVATVLNARAVALSKAGRNEEALSTIAEVLAIQAKDPDSRAYMLSLFNHGLTLKRLKRAKEGIPYLEQAVSLAETRGEEAKLSQMKAGLAETLQEVGELERALTIIEQALEIGRRAWGADSVQLATSLSVKGGLLEALGRHAEAASTLRDCLDRLERPGANPVLREVTRYELARSLWHQPGSRAAAVTMVQEVRAFFVARGAHFTDYVAECDEWLGTHPPR